MNKYIFIAFIFVVGLAYFFGERIASQKCNAKIAEIQSQNQTEIIKKMDEINEKTFNTGVRDIRDILREQYTIAE